MHIARRTAHAALQAEGHVFVSVILRKVGGPFRAAGIDGMSYRTFTRFAQTPMNTFVIAPITALLKQDSAVRSDR
jgi:hypothetical protein